MAVWLHKLRLKDFFHNEEMSFEEKRDEIAKRIRNSEWFEQHGIVAEGIVEDIENADDEYEFNFEWDAFYDFADANRIWVETF